MSDRPISRPRWWGGGVSAAGASQCYDRDVMFSLVLFLSTDAACIDRRTVFDADVAVYHHPPPFTPSFCFLLVRADFSGFSPLFCGYFLGGIVKSFTGFGILARSVPSLLIKQPTKHSALTVFLFSQYLWNYLVLGISNQSSCTELDATARISMRWFSEVSYISHPILYDWLFMGIVEMDLQIRVAMNRLPSNWTGCRRNSRTCTLGLFSGFSSSCWIGFWNTLNRRLRGF